MTSLSVSAKTTDDTECLLVVRQRMPDGFNNGDYDPGHDRHIRRTRDQWDRYFPSKYPTRSIAMPAKNTDKSDPLGQRGYYIIWYSPTGELVKLQSTLSRFISELDGWDARTLVTTA